MRYTILYNTRASFNRDSIDEVFLVNRRLLDVSLRGITKESANSIPQPRIVIGSKGTGKTWLLKAIHDLLKEEHKEFVPFYFDASMVSSLMELYSVIRPIQREKGRIVLLADNVDRLFSALSEQDMYVLRGKLSTNGAPVFVCSASSTPKALTDYSSAFFDGFDIQYVDKLSKEKVFEILKLTTEKQRIRAERLLEIVGTEVRNVMRVRNILCMSSSMDMDLQVLFDLICESMMNKINSLPKISQLIVAKLSCLNTGMTLPELRESIGLDSSKLSPYITQLVTQGILSKDVGGIRKTKYSIADGMFRFFLSYCPGFNI